MENVISAHCPDKDAKTFENLIKCQPDNLEALASSGTLATS